MSLVSVQGEQSTTSEIDLLTALNDLGISGASQAIQKTGAGTFANIDLGAGSGTVTSVSVTTANGISGTVATATTTPAITLDITALNATKIADGTVTNAEFQYLGGVTSDIQTQLDAKAGTALSNLASVAINVALVSDTDNTDALGTAAIAWADLFLGSGSVITWTSAPSTADITLTHSAGKLTFGGDGAVEIDFNNHEMTNVDINSGAIDGVIIGGASAAAATITTLTITSFAANWTNAGRTVADMGILTTVDINGGTLDAVVIGGASAAAATVTTLTVNTGITLAENASIALDPAGSADGKFSGITITGTGGTTIAVGDLIYLAVADSRWELADADALATAGNVMLGMAVSTSTDGTAVTVLLQGQIRADSIFPALTIGAAVYVGETAGDIQVAIPTGADNVIRVVGFALTADEIYFNPSQDHQTTVA